MSKEQVQILKDTLGCKQDNGLIKIYGFSYQILSNWRKKRIAKSTAVLLNLVARQHELMTEEQKEQVIEKMTSEYFSKNMKW